MNHIDFFKWVIRQIKPERLSHLMTDYGYTDDSLESVILAAQKEVRFKYDLGELLKQAIEENKAEKAIVIGGVSNTETDATLEDWRGLVQSRRLSKATGDEKKPAFDWGALLNTIVVTAGGVAANIFGTGPANVNNQNQQQPEPPKSGSTIFIVIIVVVLLIAVGAIIWLSTKK